MGERKKQSNTLRLETNNTILLPILLLLVDYLAILSAESISLLIRDFLLPTRAGLFHVPGLSFFVLLNVYVAHKKLRVREEPIIFIARPNENVVSETKTMRYMGKKYFPMNLSIAEKIKKKSLKRINAGYSKGYVG